MSRILIEEHIRAPLSTVWEMWTNPIHITKWNHASDDWECPYAENNAVTNGKFLFRMSAKDGSVSFDFTGTYKEVIPFSSIDYNMDDNRNVIVTFREQEGTTIITESFETENKNSEELQRAGWQSILTHFKNYVESH